MSEFETIRTIFDKLLGKTEVGNRKNNKNSKFKLKDKSQNIYAINAETQSYQDAFDI